MSNECNWGPGALELTERDRMIIELEKAYDRIRFLESAEESELKDLRNLVKLLKAENDALRKEHEVLMRGVQATRRHLIECLRLDIYSNERCCK